MGSRELCGISSQSIAYKAEQRLHFKQPKPEEFSTLSAQARFAEALGDLRLEIYCPRAVEGLLAVMREKETLTETFRRNADSISKAVGVHFADNLPRELVNITTPCGATQERVVTGKGVLIVKVLRSAHPFAQGIVEAMPGAAIGTVDIKRDEETAKPTLNYNGLEGNDLSGYHQVIIPDPMLATGGSAITTIDLLKKRGITEDKIHLVAMVAAPEGVLAVLKEHRGIRITAVVVDWGLDGKRYIVPGLGDFGDRYYGGQEIIEIPDPMNGVVIRYPGKNGAKLEVVRPQATKDASALTSTGEK